MKHFATLIFLFALAIVTAQNKPKLIVQLTVDQLRGDYPQLYSYQEGAFEMFLNQGQSYTNAHFSHGITVTAAGHATLATGASPSDHGIIGNDWIDLETLEEIYNTKDDRYRNVDPKGKALDGSSSNMLLGSTFSDELTRQLPGSKSIAISGKDRGAIFLAGKNGKAYWYDKSTGKMTSSTYYMDAFPEWVNNWNNTQSAFIYRDSIWSLFQAENLYVNPEIRPYEKQGYISNTFPKDLSVLKEDTKFYKEISVTPFCDDLLTSFAIQAIEKENLGMGEQPDYLSISYSATDYIGHIYGPRSREQEDNLHRLNNNIGELITYLDSRFGLENILIVLSADHGACEAPEFHGKTHIEMNPILDTLEVALKKHFNTDIDFIHSFTELYIYLNEANIKQANLNLEEVSQLISEKLISYDFVQTAYPKHAILEGDLPNTKLSDLITHSVNAERSGHVYVIPSPFFMLTASGAHHITATHGSPWSYDTWVPVYWLGMDLDAGIDLTLVHPKDIAGTLSWFLGINFPSGSRSFIPLDRD